MSAPDPRFEMFLDARRARVAARPDGDSTDPRADQILAAAKETAEVIHDVAAATDNSVLPVRDEALRLEHEARLMTALALTAAPCCKHLEAVPFQPALALLGVGVVICRACQCPEPDPADADRCDWCGALGVELFTEIVVQVGPITAFGNACDACSNALGAPT